MSDDIAERDYAKADASQLRRALVEALAEREAIRAKTIEECAKLASDRAETWHTEARRMAARDLRDAIRALAQTDEGKTESGE